MQNRNIDKREALIHKIEFKSSLHQMQHLPSCSLVKLFRTCMYFCKIFRLILHVTAVLSLLPNYTCLNHFLHLFLPGSPPGCLDWEHLTLRPYVLVNTRVWLSCSHIAEWSAANGEKQTYWNASYMEILLDCGI